MTLRVRELTAPEKKAAPKKETKYQEEEEVKNK